MDRGIYVNDAEKKKLTAGIKLNEQIDKQLKEMNLKKRQEKRNKSIRPLNLSSSGEQTDISKNITFPQLCLRAAKCQNNRIKRTEELHELINGYDQFRLRF